LTSNVCGGIECGTDSSLVGIKVNENL
jgi:hypothetical protein